MAPDRQYTLKQSLPYAAGINLVLWGVIINIVVYVFHHLR